jgi:hypothetical protein
MFGKIRNRTYSNPLKINLKTSLLAVDEEPGLKPLTGTVSVAEMEKKFWISWSRSRTKMDRLRNTYS